jgi:hypothetical protein
MYNCLVCQENIKLVNKKGWSDYQVIVVPCCSAVLHTACLDRWLAYQQEVKPCPGCRLTPEAWAKLPADQTLKSLTNTLKKMGEILLIKTELEVKSPVRSELSLSSVLSRLTGGASELSQYQGFFKAL